MACLRLYAAVMVVYSLSVTPSSAESSAELTVLAASPGNPPSGVYEYVQIVWDQKAELQYLQVRWSAPGIKFAARPGDLWRCEVGASGLASLSSAVRYAVERTPNVRHSGTVTMVIPCFKPIPERAPYVNCGSVFKS